MRITRTVAFFLLSFIPYATYAQQTQKPTSDSQTIEGTVVGTAGTKYWNGFKIESEGKEYTFVTEYSARQGTNPKIVGGKCCDIGYRIRVTYIGSLTRYLLNVTRIVVSDPAAGKPAPKPMATPWNAWAKAPEMKRGQAIITPIIVGKTIKFPNVKLADQVKSDGINTYLKDRYWNADSDAKSSFRANLQSSYDELGYKVVLNTPELLSIEISYTQYRAGDITQHHFDLSAGEAITLDQIIEPSKLDEIKKLVLDASKKRVVQVKNKILKDMRDPRGGWIGGQELWYEKDILGSSYEDAYQRCMKKNYWEVELEKKFTLSKAGLSFHYYFGFGFPMSALSEEPSSTYFYPWTTLGPFLRPSSPISRLIGFPQGGSNEITPPTGNLSNEIIANDLEQSWNFYISEVILLGPNYFGNTVSSTRFSGAALALASDYPTYLALAKKGLLKLDKMSLSNAPATAYPNGPRLDIAHAATVTLTPAGAKLGIVDYKENTVKFVLGIYRVENINSNTAVDTVMGNYRLVQGTHVLDVSPAFIDVWVELGWPTYRERKFRTIFQHDTADELYKYSGKPWRVAIASNGRYSAQDTGPRNGDFTSENVPPTLDQLRVRRR